MPAQQLFWGRDEFLELSTVPFLRHIRVVYHFMDHFSTSSVVISMLRLSLSFKVKFWSFILIWEIIYLLSCI